MLYSKLQKVCVRPPQFLDWLLNPFDSYRRNKISGRESVVVWSEKGKYSEENLYTVSFEELNGDIGLACFFEHELEPSIKEW